MRTPLILFCVVVGLWSTTIDTRAVVQPAEPWDVTTPRGQTRTIDFTTTEGTWMSVDISPDGRWLVFDLLGHVYRVAAGGGDAECLTQSSGIAVNYHPRYSPDGHHLAFVSDRGGQDHLWVMNADGTDPRAVFTEPDSRIVDPMWSPDGRFLLFTRRVRTAVAFKSVTTRIWSVPIEGGSGFEIVSFAGRSGGGERALNPHWPSMSPDGRFVYFHMTSTSDVGQLYQLRRVDTQSGRIENVTEAKPGRNTNFPVAQGIPIGEVAPEMSPDGRWLAFVRRVPGATLTYRGHEYGPRTALWLRDAQTGVDRIVMDPITSDSMSTLNIQQQLKVVPGYSWARDSKSIVLTQGGKLRRVWIDSGRVETIPFTARVHREISEMARHRGRLIDKPFEVRAARWPVSSPDGTRLVFEAAGQLWIKDLPNGAPQPLTEPQPAAFELTPSWSPDGQWIVFATWHDEQRGHVWKIGARGGRPEQLTQQPGTYLYPFFSTDGADVFVSRWPELLMRERIENNDLLDDVGWELLRMSSTGGPSEVASAPGVLVRGGFGPDGHIFYSERRGEGTDRSAYLAKDAPVPPEHVVLVSLDRHGTGPRDVLSVRGWPKDVIPSPDGRWLAVQDKQDVYLLPLWLGGRAAELRTTTLDLEVETPSAKRITLEGGYHPHWRDAQTLELVAANRHVVYHVDSGKTESTPLGLQLTRYPPTGTLALRNARVVTLDDRKVIDKGTVVIKGSRIACVGVCDTRSVDRVLDVSGATIIPGWIDLHAHALGYEPEGLIAQHRSRSARYLAYGVTTIHEPGVARPEASFAIGELIEAGRLVGPRSFSGGESLRIGPGMIWNQQREIHRYEDAEQHVNRLADRGVISIKEYQLATRTERQMLDEAARQRGLTVTGEIRDLYYTIGMIMDGHAGFEHWLNYLPLYSDAVRFFGQAGAHYSAQMYLAGYPDALASGWWLGEADIWHDQKVQRWSFWQDTATLRMFERKPLKWHPFPIMAEGAADIVRAGGFAAVGGHGEQEGLDTHWEVWSYAAGMKPIEALEAASLHSAHFLGLEQDLGSIAVGKVADLMVLRKNPLEDIRNTTSLRYVAKGGVVYDAETLDEVWPTTRPYGPRPWFSEDILRSDRRSDDHWDRPSATRSGTAVERKR